MNGLSLSQALGGLRIANPDGAGDDSADEAGDEEQGASAATQHRPKFPSDQPAADAAAQQSHGLSPEFDAGQNSSSSSSNNSKPTPDPASTSNTATSATTSAALSPSTANPSSAHIDQQQSDVNSNAGPTAAPTQFPAPIPQTNPPPQLRRAQSARLDPSASVIPGKDSAGGYGVHADSAAYNAGLSRTESRARAAYANDSTAHDSSSIQRQQQSMNRQVSLDDDPIPTPSRRTSRAVGPSYVASSSQQQQGQPGRPGNAYDPLPASSAEWQDRGAAVSVRREVDANGQTVMRTSKKGVRDFQFGHTLGEGSYSTVYAATDRHNLKEYAIKVLDKKHIIKEKKVKYVNIEKNTLNRLTDHPGIVRLYYTFQDEHCLYYVLDICSGGELLAVLKKTGTFDEECTRFYGAQILDAIEYMHSCDIIHRDLKPENLLLDSRMHIKITDFGTAKILNDSRQLDSAATLAQSNANGDDGRAASFVGTAEYVSPELLRDKNACKASDLWAYGCIMFQMLAGRPPFKAATEYLTFEKIVNLDYQFPDGFPLHARDLVERCLVQDPTQRLTIEHIKNHPFFAGQQFGKVLWTRPAPRLRPYNPHCSESGMRQSNSHASSVLQQQHQSQQSQQSQQHQSGSRTVGLLPTNSSSTRPGRIITELPPPTQLDIEWSPVLTKPNERILKLGDLLVISSPIPSSPRAGKSTEDGHKKLSRFFGGATTKKRERLVMITSNGRIVLAPAGGGEKRSKHEISLLAPDCKWRVQHDVKGQVVWCVDSGGTHYTFEETKTSGPPTPEAQSAAVAEEWIEALERAKELAIAHDMLAGGDSAFPELPSTAPSPASTLGGRSGYPEGYGVSGRMAKNAQSEETKRNIFSKRQSKNGLGSAF